MRLGRVDAGIGAVDAIGEHAIADADRAAMVLDPPDVQARPRRRQRPAGAVGNLHIEDVLRELVQRVAARRAAAHVDLDRIRGDVAEHDLDVHQVPYVVGEGQSVLDGRLGPGRGGRHEAREHGEHGDAGAARHAAVYRRARI